MRSEEVFSVFSSQLSILACSPHFFFKRVSFRHLLINFTFTNMYKPVLWYISNMRPNILHICNKLLYIDFKHSLTYCMLSCALAWPACDWVFTEHQCTVCAKWTLCRTEDRHVCIKLILSATPGPRNRCSWFSYLSMSVFMISLYICVRVSLLCCTLFWSSYPSLPEEEAGEWN